MGYVEEEMGKQGKHYIKIYRDYKSHPTSVMLRYETLLFNPDNISSKPQLEHGCTECEYSIT